MKTIFVIMDGAADLPCNELNGKTPFESACKPNLDYFSKNGQLGLVHTVGKGIAPESDVAVFSLLGYDPFKSFSGRGPLEAFGAGIDLGKSFLAFRTNFATIKGNTLLDRRAGRNLTTAEAKELEKAINTKVKLKCRFVFKSTSEHRGILVFYGKFSSKITNVDPAYRKEGNFGVVRDNPSMILPECMPLSRDASKSAALVNDFVRQARNILSVHPVNLKRKSQGLLPANIILPRDAGNTLPKINKKKKWAAIVGMPLEIGIAKLSGMKVLKVNLPAIRSRDIQAHMYATLNIFILQSLKLLKSNWNKFDNFYIHIKETDIPGHDGLPLIKKKIIEILDRKFFSGLRKFKDVRLIITSDHSTPCVMKAHSAHPVPLLAYGFGKSDNMKFSEKNAVNGSLKFILGKDLLKRLIKR